MNTEVPTILDATPPTYAPSPLPEAFRVWAMIADAGIPDADRPELARLLICRQSGKSATVYGSMVKTEEPA